MNCGLHNYWKGRIPVSFCVLAFATIVFSLLFLNRFWAGCALFCCVASVYLCAKHPGYFSLVEDGKSRIERCGTDAFLLILPFWVPVTTVWIGVEMRYGFSGWQPVLVWAGGFTIAAGLLLWRIVPELHRRRQHLILAFGLALFISFGAVVSANYVLSVRHPEYVPAVVTETARGGGKNSPTVTVLLQEGDEVRIPVHYDQHLGFQTGDTAWVVCHDGGLGIDFYNID